MDKKNRLLLFAGILILAVIFGTDLVVFHDIYFTGIAAVILAVFGMSLFIMQDATSLPDVVIYLKDDAKALCVVNRGNDTAYGIHVALVPPGTEFEIPELGADARSDYPLPSVLTESKAVVTYKNGHGMKYSKTTRLSALDKGDDDLLKPVFPLFQWK